MIEKEETSQFQTLGNNDDSAVCGPDGCNINKHRESESKDKPDSTD